MPLASPLRRLRRAARAFRSAENGNIAVLFGIAVIPLISFVGVAVDYSQATAARSAMQAAADSATLMVSKDYAAGVITAGDIQATAQKYFNALYTSTGINNITVTATYTAKSADGTSTIVMNTSGSLPTTFLKVAGFTALPFAASSTSSWGATRLRVAMALDVTGSMDKNGKLTAMKSAAKKLIDTLKASATQTADVYISIIPFNQMVNVGKTNIAATWLDWHARLTNTSNRNYDVSDYGSCSSSSYPTAALCKAANKTWTFFGTCSSLLYSTASTCTARGKTWTETRTTTWQGCVTDRDLNHTADNDTTKATPTTTDPATLFVAKNYSACSSSILPMTAAYDANESDSSTNDATLKGKINNLAANGGTNQAIGMHWAWMALQQGNPLNTPAKDADYKYTDAIILLSDGQNTIDYWYGNGSDYASQVDDRQKTLCDNIKNAANGSVTIYTIQVNTTNDPDSAVLKSCANDGQFYQSTTADQIEVAFQSIGSSLTKLRLAQ
ncbi:MAG TPA: pilus assembly protein TadG-related protein [Rhodopseudomonas sp.]|uniref:pilus assembly protein TadG-related protein n=1 Tax=Rhodopseudomonas sp. TaxID=1078 RepID=UPI002ED8AC18